MRALQEQVGAVETFEASESKPAMFELRFMVDRGLAGGGWVKVREYALEAPRSDVDAQIVATAAAAAVEGAEMELRRCQQLAPLRILSVDVVSVGSVRQLHHANVDRPEDKIILITATLSHHMAAAPVERVALVLQPPGEPWDVRPSAIECGTACYRSEGELLLGFERLVATADPDFVTGSDIGQDLQMMRQRAEAVGLRDFGAYSRRAAVVTKVAKRQTYNPKWVKAKGRQAATSNQVGILL